MNDSSSIEERWTAIHERDEQEQTAREQAILDAPADQRDALVESYEAERRAKLVQLGTDRAGALLRPFFKIMALWEMDDSNAADLLGEDAANDIARYRSDPDGCVLSVEQVIRIGHVLGIYTSFASLFGDGANGRRWLRMPVHEPPFSGRTPLDLMRLDDVENGSGAVRYHLLCMMYSGWG